MLYVALRSNLFQNHIAMRLKFETQNTTGIKRVGCLAEHGARTPRCTDLCTSYTN